MNIGYHSNFMDRIIERADKRQERMEKMINKMLDKSEAILQAGKPQEQTNEEWFCQLPTEEKARWLYDHYVNARADEYYGRQEKTLSEYQKWLVSVHRKIDGTKID